ncbi:Fungal specific transcription factor domain-containing protein [Cladophialophora immunda]|nr:Fungal specific transcription factor domain-containing protein [Cladophialophora immunda]
MESAHREVSAFPSRSPQHGNGRSPSRTLRPFRRRRENRACIACRARKTKCDISLTGHCSSCVAAGIVCEVTEPSAKQQNTILLKRIRELEQTVEKFTKQVEQIGSGPTPEPLRPDGHNGYSLSHLTSRRSSPSPKQADRRLSTEIQSSPTLETAERSSLKQRRRCTNGSPSLQTHVTGDGTKTYHFYGSTSELVFLDSVREYVQQLGYEVPASGNSWRTNLDITPTRVTDNQLKSNVAAELRSQLPSQRLGAKLIEVYAQHVQAHTPILYWPSILIKFQRIYTRSPLHYEEAHITADFCVMMMVFAVGSQLSDLAEVGHGSGQQMRNGWGFFEAARRCHRLIKSTYTLDDAIITLLMSIYLLGASMPSPCWVMTGTTSRIVQDLGLHKRPSPHQLFNVEIESRNRLFWGAYMVDRIVALTFGRPVLLLDEDCDVDLPGKVDEKGTTSPHSLRFFRTSISVVSLLDSIIQLDAIPRNEENDVETMMKIDAQLLACWYRYPRDLTNDDADESIEPSTLKILFITQQARLALFRHFTNNALNNSFRNACLKKSVETSRLTAKIMLRIAKGADWEDGIAHRCNDIVYNHIFRAAIVLLLEHRLKASSGMGKVHGRGAAQNRNINILWRSLRAAAQTHLSASKSLELLQVFANTLNFDLSLTETSDEYTSGDGTTDVLIRQEPDVETYDSLPAPALTIDAAAALTAVDVLSSPSPQIQPQPKPRPGLGSNSTNNLLLPTGLPFPKRDGAGAAAATTARDEEEDRIGTEKRPSPSHCSVGSEDMDWAMFHELLDHDSIFEMYAGGVNGNDDFPVEF